MARGDRDLIGKWTQPMGYPPISPMFTRSFAQAGVARGDPPHPDALTVEAAIERLGLTKAALPAAVQADLVYEIGFEVDVKGAARAALGNVVNLVLVYARNANRPALRLEPLEIAQKRAENGKPGVYRLETWLEPTFGERADFERSVEAACVAKRKDLDPAGAYCVLEYEPSAQELVNERAEYAVWRAALEWLAVELADSLESRAALPPRAAARPWRGERDAPALRDFFAPRAERVFGGDEAATLVAERAIGRRRLLAGGGVYSYGPVKLTPGARRA